MCGDVAWLRQQDMQNNPSIQQTGRVETSMKIVDENAQVLCLTARKGKHGTMKYLISSQRAHEKVLTGVCGKIVRLDICPRVICFGGGCGGGGDEKPYPPFS